MISTQDLSELVGTLYAAPLQPEKWQVFFDSLSRLTKISSGYLITGSKSKGPEILAGGGCSFNPEVLELYKEHYSQIDPFWPPYLRDPRVAVIRGQELITQDKLVRTEFYTDMLANHEMEYQTLMSCSSSVERTDVMPMWRRSQDGPMDETSITLLQAVLPHANAALRIRARLQTADLQGQFGEMALDALSTACFLVASTGRVQYMNKLAVAVVTGTDGLHLENSVLTACRATENAQLKSFILGAALGDTSGTRTPGGSLSVSRQGLQAPLRVSVLPVPENLASKPWLTCALVFVIDPTSVPQSRAASLRQLYALTPTEARLADLLLEGLKVSEVADRMNITLETARCNLKRVLVKTGAHRQTELMRLMLSLPG